MKQADLLAAVSTLIDQKLSAFAKPQAATAAPATAPLAPWIREGVAAQKAAKPAKAVTIVSRVVEPFTFNDEKGGSHPGFQIVKLYNGQRPTIITRYNKPKFVTEAEAVALVAYLNSRR